MLPTSFNNIFTYEYTTHTYETRQRNCPRPDTPRTFLAKLTIRYAIPELVNALPSCITDKITTHSIQGLANYSKKYFLNLYKDRCSIEDCYICEINDPNPEWNGCKAWSSFHMYVIIILREIQCTERCKTKYVFVLDITLWHN